MAERPLHVSEPSVLELIAKKRDGHALSEDEIAHLVAGYAAGDIPDHQMSALLMAICIRGLSPEETAALTLAMVRTGRTIDLSSLKRAPVDKHSTGGVGDTTTLVVGPVVAAAGVPFSKLSGRSLGHTGGTLDKLESIPGMRTNLSAAEFVRQVEQVGIAIAAQGPDMVPADGKMYALRDATATVSSVPLIAASVMSKKLAAGAQNILIDVKVGSGAFMKDEGSARVLAQALVRVAGPAGVRVVALLTDMSQPLGRAIGNALEVEEAIATLKGEGPVDLTELCLQVAGRLLVMGGAASNFPVGREQARQMIETGQALDKLRELIGAQGGDPRVIDDPSLLPQPHKQRDLVFESREHVVRVDAEAVGRAVLRLERAAGGIDPAGGLVMHRKLGETLDAGHPLFTLYASSEAHFDQAEAVLRGAVEFSPEQVAPPPLVYGVVT